MEEQQYFNTIIYHANCVDGYAARFVAERSLRKTLNEEQIAALKFIPCSYGNEPPTIENSSSAAVLILDFSFSAEFTDDLIKTCARVLIIDHHKTAEAALSKIPQKNKIFDMRRSAAALAWEYFNPGVDVPRFINLVEDRDLWKKSGIGADELHSYLMGVIGFEDVAPSDKSIFDTYSQLIANDSAVTDAIEHGRNINKYEMNQVRRIANYASINFVTIMIDKKPRYYFAAHVSSGVYQSDIGNELIQRHKNIDFSAVFGVSANTQKTLFSLRSANNEKDGRFDRADVSVIAAQYGGGGHRNASGCAIMAIVNTVGSDVKFDAHYLYETLDKLTYVDGWVYARLQHGRRNFARYLLQAPHTVVEGGPRNMAEVVLWRKIAEKGESPRVHSIGLISFSDTLVMTPDLTAVQSTIAAPVLKKMNDCIIFDTVAMHK